MITPVILSGGSGTRLWPLSRAGYPKQFLPLTDARSLFQLTLLRLGGLSGCTAALVAHKERAQDVKKLVDRLKAAGRSEATVHREVFRPWGSYDAIDEGRRFKEVSLELIEVQTGAYHGEDDIVRFEDRYGRV